MNLASQAWSWGVLAALVVSPNLRAADAPAGGAASVFATPLSVRDLDPAAFTGWVDGREQALTVNDGPKHVMWTRDSQPQWDGVRFGDSKTPGSRHLRVGWNAPLPVGAVLVRAGGQLSVLKPDATYPGDLSDDTQWLPAQRLVGRQAGREEVQQEEYALWVLPPRTSTRALRFTHVAAPTERAYAGWLGGAFVLSPRLVNLAPQALVLASSRNEAAGKIIDGTNNNAWQAWDNGKEGAAEVVSPEHPEWVMLIWPRPVTLCGLNALWAGFGAADVQTYTGPAERHPREASEADWRTIRAFDAIANQYPRALGVNWMDLGEAVTTRAVRLRLTRVTTENHPHLNGKTYNGKRIWLGELLALAPLGDAALETAVLPASAPPDATDAAHAPVPVRFTLPAPGVVTLVIDDPAGKRVRNLVSATAFPAGDNVVWWDALDDVGRDPEAARHGVYHVPGAFVAPGEYRVHGLARQGIDLRYEFSIYNAGNPAWETADSTGAWLTNHTPPSAALYVPAEQAPGGQALMYLGSYVAEGGHGLAWVDLDGKKVGGRGWVGGAWTGAPFLARDAGTGRDGNTYVYVGAAWDKDLRLTALTKAGDKPVIKYAFEKKEDAALTGLAVHDGVLVCSLPKLKQLLFVDVKAGKVLAAAGSPDDPRGLAFDAQGRLLLIAGKQVLRYAPPKAAPDVALPAAEVVVREGLEDPQHVALDDAGNLYVSDRGASHQVKVFAPDGKFLRAIGRAGAPAAGPYDPLHMNNPAGLTVDGRGRLWVTETDYQPKRVSVWTPDGQLVRVFYGPSEYGGGGKLDPQDPTRFFYHGMEFKLDWDAGRDQIVRVFHRPAAGDLKPPDGHACDGQPEEPLYHAGQRYFTNCYNCNPTNGAAIAMLWIDRAGIARPVAAVGRANDWSLLKGEAFRGRWPGGVDAKGDYWKSQALFLWCDANGDGQVQPEEVTIIKATAGGVTVMPDLAFVVARVDGRAMRYAPREFTAQGVPRYDLGAGEVLFEGAQGPTSSGGDQVLVSPAGWSIATVAPKPWAPQSIGGVYQGTPRWSYPDPWPGLHASHEAPAPDFPGQIIGTTRLLGSFITPRGDAGPLWCLNGNMGNMYLFTADGLFVAELFHDVRQGKSWSMPAARRGMALNDLSLHDENFWPSLTQTADGRVFLVDGGRTSLVRVEGLDTIRRLPEASLRVSEDDLRAAQTYRQEREAARQRQQGQETLRVALRDTAPTVDGKLDDWAGAAWVSIDKRGVAANFDSNSKPYDVTAAAAVAGDRLFVAFRTGDPQLLRNTGDQPTAPFKTGGALDVMLGTNPGADAKRSRPVAGDVRLLVTLVNKKPLALVYRAVVAGAKEPVPFSSPWRTITFDRVDNVSDQVQLAGADGNYELSVPLAALGLTPAPGQALRGDLGVLRGNGFQTLQRVYWQNKATAIVADVPSEAELTPQLWGQWVFGKP